MLSCVALHIAYIALLLHIENKRFYMLNHNPGKMYLVPSASHRNRVLLITCLELRENGETAKKRDREQEGEKRKILGILLIEIKIRTVVHGSSYAIIQ